MYLAINTPVHENNVVDGINATDKHHLREQMELLGKLLSNDTSKLECLLLFENISPLDFQKNVNTFPQIFTV